MKLRTKLIALVLAVVVLLTLPTAVRRVEEYLYPCKYPQVVETSGSQTVLEGCLSFPGQWGMITRPDRVKLRAQDRHGKWFVKDGQGLLAQAMLHENGHLDGLVFKEDPSFRPLTEEELEELEAGD